MGHAGIPFKIPLNDVGLDFSRNNLLAPAISMEDIRNLNTHEGGLGKRGGTSKYQAVGLFASGNGGFEEQNPIFDGFTQNNSLLSATIFEEDCSSLSGYSISQSPPLSVVEVDPAGQFHLFGSVNRTAIVYKDWGTIGLDYTLDIRWLFDDLNAFKANFISIGNSGGKLLQVMFDDSGPGIYVTNSSGVDVLLSGSSSYIDGTWNTWKFNVTGGDTLSIYKNGILIYSGIDCGYSSGTDGIITLKAIGAGIANAESHIEWYKIFDPVHSGSYSSKLIAGGSATNGCKSDALTIDPNVDYSINLFYFVTSYTAGTAEIEMVFNDGSVTTVDIVSAIATTSGWIELTYTFGPNGTTGIPSDATTVTFQQKWTGSATGTFFIDDISIPTSDERITGLKQFKIVKADLDYLLRATPGKLWSSPSVQIKTGLDTHGDEVLKEGSLDTHDKWSVTNDFDDTGGNLAYTHSAGEGTATQTSSDFQRDLKAGKEYDLVYVVSGVTDTPACNLTTGIASVLTALTLTNGTQTTRFTTNSTPGNLVFDVPSSGGTDAFVLDNISLKEVVAYPTDINVFNERAVSTNGRNVPQIFTGLTVLDIPAAPIAGLVAATGGNCTNGKHKVIVTYVNANGETIGSPESIEIEVKNNSIEGQIKLTSIPVGPNEVTGRSIYMNEAGGTVFYKVTSGAGATIGDNHTTEFEINLADGTLDGYNILPTTNTATTGTATKDLGVDGLARPGALTSAGSGAGSGILLDANPAVYSYKATFHNVHGETIGGDASTDIIITDAWDQINLTAIPIGPLGVTARSLYRTEGDGSAYKLLTVISDNSTTTYTDNKADANLGSAAPTSNTAATRPADWVETNQPKYSLINESQNLSSLWLFGCPETPRRIYNDPLGGENFTEANHVRFDLGEDIVGGIQYGSRPVFFGNNNAYIIINTSSTTSDWTYYKAPWRGGVAHHQLIVQVENDIHCFPLDGNIYSITTVQQYGDYRASSLTKIGSMDRWIKQNIDLSYIADFHGEYDPILRSVFWFVVRKGQTDVDTTLVWSIDKQKWTIQDNRVYASGFSASASTLYDFGAGDFRIVTGDYSGQVWRLNEISKNDDGNGYRSGFKLNRFIFDLGRGVPEILDKQVNKGFIVQEVMGSHELNIDIWSDGEASGLNTQTVDCNARYREYEIGAQGRDLQVEIWNDNANEDYFLMELVFYFKYQGALPE